MMRVLAGSDLRVARTFLKEAQKEASNATCLRRKCGAVLVSSEGFIIGRGFNSPPGNLESQRRCNLDKSGLHEKVTDKTCCIHAERRALRDALKSVGDITGSTMYFTSVDNEGNRIFSGKPYCTACSKATLDEGVAFWVLEHEEWTAIYSSTEYNTISFRYNPAQNL